MEAVRDDMIAVAAAEKDIAVDYLKRALALNSTFDALQSAKARETLHRIAGPKLALKASGLRE